MIKNKPRLLALDLDGTVLRSNNTLSQEVKAAIHRAVAHDIEVVVASGRPYGSMPRDILAIEGLNYVIASNGAAIYDGRGNRIHSSLMSERDVLRLLELTKDYDLIWEAFREGEICTDRRYYEDPVSFGCSAAYVEYVRSSRGCSDDMRGYIYRHRQSLDSVEFVCSDAPFRQALRAELEAELTGLYITSSSADFVEFMDKSASKSNAMRRICAMENIPLSDTVACGNADNDADMLQQAGLGAAVQNASELCLAAADMVVASNDDHGVRDLINFILQK